MHRPLLGALVGLIWIAAPINSFAGPETSLRPMPRVSDAPVVETHAVRQSIRPLARGALRNIQPVAQIRPPEAAPIGFAAWRAEFRPRALAAGISRRTFDRAFAQIEYLPVVVERDRNQSEFSKQIWEYLSTAVSDHRIRSGRAAFTAQSSALRAIERRYGVDPYIVTAIWGLETAYGAVRGSTSILSAMATLAYDGRRKDFFEDQLIAALTILDKGQASTSQMRGSWAGAMGHTQFMPDSYLAYAVDGTGDGRRDIWGDNPVDALASTANYLRQKGWTPGQPWGLEVRLPAGFDFGQTGERIKKSGADWTALGVRTLRGQAVPDHGPASVLVPAGVQGAAFVIYNNFHVIESYNPADAYVIGVGHLADRIRGGPAIQAGWPAADRALSISERREMQRHLLRVGCDPLKLDGIVGPDTQEAIRCFQRRIGQVPDGYANTRLLTRLRDS